VNRRRQADVIERCHQRIGALQHRERFVDQPGVVVNVPLQAHRIRAAQADDAASEYADCALWRSSRDDARVVDVMTIDELAARMNEKFDGLEKKVDDGFKDSKIRDEELRDLMKFGLEAREVLRDEIHRRFDDSDRRQEEQIALLKDAVRHSIDRK
jgi:hypothetical protein